MFFGSAISTFEADIRSSQGKDPSLCGGGSFLRRRRRD
jgi:hypothetical protein